ncbi:MAG TPA: CorA family divalent cation transporter [Aldersonia sp.]
MDVRFISDEGVRSAAVSELRALLDRPDGLVWVDVPTWDDQADEAFTTVFGFHPLAVRDSMNRNQVPKVHRYTDHFFVVLHAPQSGARGHVHYVELDQFIGGRYLVTVHGPVNPAIDPSTAMVEVDAVLGRLESGRLQPGTAFELSFALLAALTARMRAYTAELTKDVWKLEQQVTGGHLGDPETFSTRCSGSGMVCLRSARWPRCHARCTAGWSPSRRSAPARGRTSCSMRSISSSI